MVFVAGLVAVTAQGSESAVIAIDASKPKGKVVRELLGTEIKCFHGGQGLMTGLRSPRNDFRPEVMEWVEKLAPTFMRYKFIRGNWNWEDGIGPMARRADDRARQKYMGIDEILAFQSRVLKDGSKCHLVVNPRDPQQCAALVAYLNIPAGDPQKNRHDQAIGVSKENGRDYKTIGYWANLRAEHGHPQPYGVTWFEIGNENYMRDAGFNGDPKVYCARAKDVVTAMKAVDPGIRCGLNMEAYPTKNQNWRPTVIKEGGAFADYFVCHAYYPFGYPRNERYIAAIKNLDKKGIEELYYKMIMAGAHQGLSDWCWFRGQMKALTPRADEIRLCLTENGFHLDVYDPKAQNTVLVGVYDADLIGMMVEHADELKLDNANLFYLQGDDNWTFIAHSFANSDKSAITIRPPFYALFLWTHYFGDTLLATAVTSGTFAIPLPDGGDWPKDGILWTRIAAQEGIPLLAAHASVSADGQKLYLIAINRDLHNDIEAEIRLTGFSAAAQADVHCLNTSAEPKSGRLEDMFAVWDSNNEDKPGTVSIRDSCIDVAGPVFKHKFPAHSATAVVVRLK